MAKITGHHFVNRPPETLTRKECKALRQSNEQGRTSKGYGEKTGFRPDNNLNLILIEDNWAKNLEII